MDTRPRHPANSRVRDSQAAAAAGGEIVVGRRRVAHALGLSERQTSRLISSGVLRATRAADVPNRPLAVRAADLKGRA